MKITEKYQNEICHNWFAYKKAKETELACKFADECNKTGTVKIKSKNGLIHIMHQSAKQAGTYQVSCFTDTGVALGDRGEVSLSDAAYYMVEMSPAEATDRPDLSAYVALKILRGEYFYDMMRRPLSINTAPDGWIRIEDGQRYERLVYKYPLTQKVIDKYELKPVGHITSEEYFTNNL